MNINKLQRTIGIKYCCDLCGIKDRVLNVVARRRDEEIQQWMNKLIMVIYHDHKDRSPRCPATEITRVWIPLNTEGSDKGIGEAIDATKSHAIT